MTAPLHEYTCRKLWPDDRYFHTQCSSRHHHAFCENLSAYRVTSSYDTARRGIMHHGNRRRYLCERHAREFCARHGLPFPDQLEIFFPEDRHAP